jgi:hypothetical protein
MEDEDPKSCDAAGIHSSPQRTRTDEHSKKLRSSALQKLQYGIPLDFRSLREDSNSVSGGIIPISTDTPNSTSERTEAYESPRFHEHWMVLKLDDSSHLNGSQQYADYLKRCEASGGSLSGESDGSLAAPIGYQKFISELYSAFPDFTVLPSHKILDIDRSRFATSCSDDPGLQGPVEKTTRLDDGDAVEDEMWTFVKHVRAKDGQSFPSCAEKDGQSFPSCAAADIHEGKASAFWNSVEKTPVKVCDCSDHSRIQSNTIINNKIIN